MLAHGLFRCPFGPLIGDEPPPVARCARYRKGDSEHHGPISMPAGFRPVPGASGSQWRVTNARRVSCELSEFECELSLFGRAAGCASRWQTREQSEFARSGAAKGAAKSTTYILHVCKGACFGRACQNPSMQRGRKNRRNTSEVCQKLFFRTKFSAPETRPLNHIRTASFSSSSRHVGGHPIACHDPSFAPAPCLTSGFAFPAEVLRSRLLWRVF